MLYCKQVNLNNKNDSLTQIYNLIPANSRVLDVGCATGGLAYSLSQNKACCVVGIEFNPQSVAVCKKAGIFEEIFQYDMNNFDLADFKKYQASFDYIVCADILEHLLQPKDVLQVLMPLLQKDGHIIISLPNVAHASIKTNLLLDDFTYTEMGILDKTHLHFYTYKSIAELLSDCNLRIIKASSVNMPIDGWQPHKISELPQEVANFIIKDKHSHIMQYVMLCARGNISSNDNTIILDSLANEPTNSNITAKIKRAIMLKMPKMIKFIEAIKK